MTIHHWATPVGIDYIAAPCISRLARLLSATYGAVVLLGDIARRRVESRLSDGVTPCIPGQHRVAVPPIAIPDVSHLTPIEDHATVDVSAAAIPSAGPELPGTTIEEIVVVTRHHDVGLASNDRD